MNKYENLFESLRGFCSDNAGQLSFHQLVYYDPEFISELFLNLHKILDSNMKDSINEDS